MESVTDSDGSANAAEGRLGNTMLSAWDVVAVAVYLVLVMTAGILSLFRPGRNTVSGYFLAGRFMSWLPVGASLFASNIGSEHFIGLAGSGAAAGVAVGAFELNALLLLQLLGWVFLPVFIASRVTTLPEYMSKRFGGRRIRTCLAIFSILLYIFTKISVNMYSGAVFLQQALRWNNIYICIVILLVLTALCSAVGGLAAVIYTDTLQFFVMIAGSLVLSFKALSAVGGLGALHTSYLEAIPTPLLNTSACGLPRHDSWVMLRGADTSTSDLPWPGFLLGQTPASIWYWCADQMMVQRAMASKNLSHAKGATLFAGVFKLLPLLLIIIPGMVSRVLFTNEIACVDPDACFEFCGSRVSCTNSAYPKLVLELLPGGMRGVILAVMLSALISDLTSIFNSAATLFTVDLWTYFRPRADAKEQLLCARLFIVLLLVISVAWVPIIERIQGGQMYIYIQSVAAYLSPPIAAIYCMALFNKKTTEPGAFWGLILGFIVGLVRMMLDFNYPEPLCYEEDTRPYIVRLHYMYFATILFWLTLVVTAIVSLVTPQLQPWRLVRATFWSRHSTGSRDDELSTYDTEQTKESEYPLNIESENYTKEQIIDGDYPLRSKSCVHEDTTSLNLTEKVYRVKEVTNRKEEAACHGKCMILFKKLMGINSTSDSNKKSTKSEVGMEHDSEVRLLASLHQEKWEKVLLNSLLGVMFVLCLALGIYFSINPFTNDEIKLLQENRLREMNISLTI